MQKINRDIDDLLFRLTLSIPADHTQQILHHLTKASMDI